MRKIQNKKSGFTLIELMIVVAILGILAAIAIPAFATYIRRSKAGEVGNNIEAMFKAVSAYYNKEFTSSANINATVSAHCVVPAVSTIATATDVKSIALDALFNDPTDPLGELGGIGFNPGASYYIYQTLPGALTGCGLSSNQDRYTLQAQGDLDNDAVSSTFQLVAVTNAQNEIYKAGTTFIISELE